jgi:hypothetical protein
MNVHVAPSSATEVTVDNGLIPTRLDAATEAVIADLPAAGEDELIVLYKAYRIASEALNGIFNRPRTAGLAADIIEDEIERCDRLACAIAERLGQLDSVSNYKRPDYIETMTSHVFYCGGNADEAMEVIAKAMATPVREESSCAPGRH